MPTARAIEAIDVLKDGGVRIIAALQGAVVGGGLELASAAHIRVMDQTAGFAPNEGQRGLITGGGATMRVNDLGLAPDIVAGSSLDKEGNWRARPRKTCRCRMARSARRSITCKTCRQRTGGARCAAVAATGSSPLAVF